MFGSCRPPKRVHNPLGRLGCLHFIQKWDELGPNSTAIMLCCHFCALTRPPLQRHESKPPNPKTVGHHNQEPSVQAGFIMTAHLNHQRVKERTHRAYSNPRAANSKSWGTQDTYLSMHSAARIPVRRNATLQELRASKWYVITKFMHACANHITDLPLAQSQIQRRKPRWRTRG